MGRCFGDARFKTTSGAAETGGLIFVIWVLEGCLTSAGGEDRTPGFLAHKKPTFPGACGWTASSKGGEKAPLNAGPGQGPAD